MPGVVTNIQPFSLHDGPGIRTTVFMKGCNVQCLSCHNMETFSFEPELFFFQERCIGCGACLAACETGTLSQKKRGVHSLLHLRKCMPNKGEGACRAKHACRRCVYPDGGGRPITLPPAVV